MSVPEDGEVQETGSVPENGTAPLWVQTLTVTTADQTHALGAALAEVLRAGDLLVLTGELGAGKTTFTQGLGEGLGVREGIISPTFVLVRIHPNLPEGPRPGGPWSRMSSRLASCFLANPIFG